MTQTIVEEKIFIQNELLHEIEEEKQVIIHCQMIADEYSNAARIWPSTYIIDNQSGQRNQLLFADGITMYPTWTYIKEYSSLNFTLIFGGLPKSCKSFDLVEIIPQAGGFEYRKIPRNKTDVYHINLD
ncbi:hypothetical protein [Chishuiella sp.]|uniref:hypothetical protein n=1 Tax=Chishuiella sp. TaxID=1969467 RepID=UPI0028AA648E|nr:hypothetical protein [Chishuiella sp.]